MTKLYITMHHGKMKCDTNQKYKIELLYSMIPLNPLYKTPLNPKRNTQHTEKWMNFQFWKKKKTKKEATFFLFSLPLYIIHSKGKIYEAFLHLWLLWLRRKVWWILFCRGYWESWSSSHQFSQFSLLPTIPFYFLFFWF